MERDMAMNSEVSRNHIEPMPKLFFWPWRGIIANIPFQGKEIDEIRSQLQDQLTNEGFNPVNVSPLYSYKDHSMYALVEFTSDWLGFTNSIKFETSFGRKKWRKTDYMSQNKKEMHLYGWVAESDDYYSEGIIGENLRKIGSLKTIADIEEALMSETGKLVLNLTNELEVKDMLLKDLEHEYTEATSSHCIVMAVIDEIKRVHNEAMKEIEENTRGQVENMLREHEKEKLKLEKRKRELEEKERIIEKREAEQKRIRVSREKEMIERAAFEQNEKIRKLVEEHEVVKEILDMKIVKLKRKIDAKQALEWKNMKS